jgi:hypothetical protein
MKLGLTWETALSLPEAIGSALIDCYLEINSPKTTDTVQPGVVYKVRPKDKR